MTGLKQFCWVYSCHTDCIYVFLIIAQDLEGIFKKSDDGLLLLRSYKNEGRLDNDLRNKLAKIIVSNELSSNINNTITSDRAVFLSNHIKKLFPTEEKASLILQNTDK